jgi:hypothetical protein
MRKSLPSCLTCGAQCPSLTKKYCSSRCWLRTPRSCQECGSRLLKHQRKYCSLQCMGAGQTGEGNPNWKDGTITLSDGRTAIYAPGHPGAVLFGGTHILAYRLVAENTLGRCLSAGEIVHHINGDCTDNRPENLQVMTQAEHARLELQFRTRDAAGRLTAGIFRKENGLI